MIKSYFLMAARNLRRDKLYAFINVTGLAVGVAGFLIAALYLRHELTYDGHNENADRIYRINSEVTRESGASLIAMTSPLFGYYAARDFPQIESYVRFRRPVEGALLLRNGDTAYYENDVFVADAGVFDMFTHEVVYGTTEGALSERQTIALSESFSRKYFGETNPVGQILSTENYDYRVTLVFEDLPDNTHFKYDALMAYAGIYEPNYASPRAVEFWNASQWTYMTFHDEFEVSSFGDLSDEYYQRYMADFGDPVGQSMRYFAEPLTDIHLHSITRPDTDRERGNVYYVYGFMAIGLFILGVACVNYVNLATARSIRRMKAVAMRRLLGADRRKLISQFLSEALLVSFLAVGAGLGLVEILLSSTPLPSLLGKELALQDWGWNSLLIGSLALATIISLTSGLYPSIYMTATSPLAGLRQWHIDSKVGLRQFLVIFQFTVSAAVISCAILMFLQIRYVQGLDLGFEKENKIFFNVRGADSIENIESFVNEIGRDPGVLGVSMVRSSVPGELSRVGYTGVLNPDGEIDNYSFNKMWVDDEYLDLLDIEVVQGRDFDPNRATEFSDSVLVNEALVRHLGWEQPIGQMIDEGNGPLSVVGVVEDFHFQRLQTEIVPLVIFLDRPSFQGFSPVQRRTLVRQLIVGLSGEFTPETLETLRVAWREFNPNHPFQYEFLDESLNQLYGSSQNQLALVGIFSLICILISNLGLFGLTAFSTEQRTKEIGIRKILGASTTQIILMLFRNILKLVLCGSIVAAIISFWAMNEWLDGFYYHTEINPAVFLISALLSLAIAFLTVTLQSYKTAEANPVLALRYE